MELDGEKYDMKLIFLILISYLTGSIPFGYLIAKRKGINIFNVGSGNIGATNISRVLGKKLGVLVLILDALKGAIPTLIAYKIFSIKLPLLMLIPIAAIAGHCFSIFLKLKGGKGVATSLGSMLVIFPLQIGLCFAIFAIVLLIWGYVSLASIISSLAFPIIVLISGYNINVFLFTLFIALFILYRHKGNINRLLQRRESKFLKSN